MRNAKWLIMIKITGRVFIYSRWLIFKFTPSLAALGITDLSCFARGAAWRDEPGDSSCLADAAVCPQRTQQCGGSAGRLARVLARAAVS